MTAPSFILYEGPSQLDGEPIVCIVTAPAIDQRKTYKTQGTVQTYIILRDQDPIEAVRDGDDESICGDCMHRRGPQGRSCFVPVWGSVRNIWLAYQRGKYRPWMHAEDQEALAGSIVRIGSYGDPAAVQFDFWPFLLNNVAATVGYTHQWRTCDQRLSRWCMASCESELDYARAKQMGWRTFRVRASAAYPVLSREVICPASNEAGHKTDCASCRACGGMSSKAHADIVIIAHGDKGKVRAFERKAHGL